MIGASAAVFGVVGAHIYTAVCSDRHPATIDSITLLLWLGKVAMEFAWTPFSLDHISMLFEDSIDHSSHVCGFIGGFLLAVVWDEWHRPKLQISEEL